MPTAKSNRATIVVESIIYNTFVYNIGTKGISYWTNRITLIPLLLQSNRDLEMESTS